MAIGFLQHDNENRRMATTCDRCLAWQVAEVWELKAARSPPFSSDFALVTFLLAQGTLL
jgi:hypothetical protein